MSEIWRNVKDFEGLYIVSSEGRVFSVASNRLLKISTGENYVQVRLKKGEESKTYYLHRIVATAFIPNPGNLPEVNHKDGNKANNNVENLEWVTRSGNMLHCWRVLHPNYRSGKHVRGVNVFDGSVLEFRSAKEACDFLGLDHSAISKAIQRNGKAGNYKWEYYDPNEVSGDDKDERID